MASTGPAPVLSAVASARNLRRHPGGRQDPRPARPGVGPSVRRRPSDRYQKSPRPMVGRFSHPVRLLSVSATRMQEACQSLNRSRASQGVRHLFLSQLTEHLRGTQTANLSDLLRLTVESSSARPACNERDTKRDRLRPGARRPGPDPRMITVVSPHSQFHAKTHGARSDRNCSMARRERL